MAPPVLIGRVSPSPSSSRGQVHSQRPSRLLLGLEGRAALEMAGLPLALPLLMRHVPRGDGHPVLVLPGLLASDASTAALRAFLASLGYTVHGWGQGTNLGPRTGVLANLQATLAAVRGRDQRKVSVIGWSLGGIYARELARTAPLSVRQVVTLGSPLHGDPDRTTHASGLYHLAAGSARVEDSLRDVGAAPVPTTSIYSRSDGVVAGGASVERPGPQVENVEVRYASHTGLGFNPLVWLVVGDRLAQAEGVWHRFAPPAWLKRMFPATPDEIEAAS